MSGSKILRAVLVVSAAITLLTVHASLGETAQGQSGDEECKTSPGSSAPAGQHWYYRINHADNRHCWYLGSEATKVHAHALTAAAHASPNALPREQVVDAAPPARAEAAPEQITPAPITPAATAAVRTSPAQVAYALATPAEAVRREMAVPQRTPAEFTARWPDHLPDAVDLNGPPMAASGGGAADTSAAADGAKEAKGSAWPWSLVAAAFADPAGFEPAFFRIAAATAALLLVVAVFRLTRRPPRDIARRLDSALMMRERAAPVTGRRSAAAVRRRDAGWQAPTPTDPANDVKRSLRELMRDMQRAAAARKPERSFVPAAHISKVAAE